MPRVAATSSMAAFQVLLAVAFAFCAQLCSGAATGDIVSHSLRGRSAAESIDDLEPAEGSEAESDSDTQDMTPLYDDFLDIMNNAAAKAISEQRAIPAYDDFLHLMKHSAETALKNRASTPSYNEFLHFMKGKTDEAYQQQIEMPSYDDFLFALKASSVEALKVPVPTYEEFLNVLKVGAESAMETRVRKEMSGESTVATRGPVDETIVQGDANQLAEAGKFIPSMNPRSEKTEGDEGKLRKELRELVKKKREAKRRHGGNVPDHLKKPLMGRINVLRTQLCWKRPNLWKHEKCLRFLGIHCLQESTGEGICKAFTKKAQDKCKTSKNPKWREDYCALGEALDDTYGDHEDDEEEGMDDADGEDEYGGDGKSKTGDKDGDGVVDAEDGFPDDPNEWKDTDGDGIGDNSDTDIDGDGHENQDDVFPHDKTEWLDSDNDGIGDNKDTDRDNDGVDNDKDEFPDDPTEWKDSDKDGVGDNKDAYPYNPNCHSPTEPCVDISKNGKPEPGSPEDPATLNKVATRPLPAQGFSEAMTEGPVRHANYYTYTSDWQEEFPEMAQSEGSTMDTICREHPKNAWCQKFKHRDGHFR